MSSSNTQCALCQQASPLRKSHIIPKFVVRFALQSSAGLLRTVQNPNLRVQDGIKLKLLCDSCEQLLSGWESSFADQVFLPIHTKEPTEFKTFNYGPWCMKFAASVAWRAVQFLRHEGSTFEHLSRTQQQALGDAEMTWRSLILNTTPHPGPHELHLFSLEALASLPRLDAEFSSYLNRYILRGQAVDIAACKGLSFVYVKMLKLVLLGFIEPPKAAEWHGGKLRVRRGEVGSRKLRWPDDFFLYINSHAKTWHDAMRSTSRAQHEKIDQVLKKAGQDFYDTECFRATAADVAMFGRKAFFVDTDEEET